MAGFFTGDGQRFMADLGITVRDGGLTARDISFAPGGRVEQCAPVPAEGKAINFDSIRWSLTHTPRIPRTSSPETFSAW